MFVSNFDGLSKSDLISLNNGSVLIDDHNDEIKEYSNAGIGITKESVNLIKTKSFGRTALKETINISEIDKRSIKLDSARDFNKERKVSGISILAGQGPFTSMKFEKTVLQFSTGKSDYVIEIPDSKKVKKRFNSIKEKNTKKDNEGKKALKILEERLAKGEISEDEFNRKKDLVED
jgi:hypothetical protein